MVLPTAFTKGWSLLIFYNQYIFQNEVSNTVEAKSEILFYVFLWLPIEMQMKLAYFQDKSSFVSKRIRRKSMGNFIGLEIFYERTHKWH